MRLTVRLFGSEIFSVGTDDESALEGLSHAILSGSLEIDPEAIEEASYGFCSTKGK
jgi:hypothetical protein